MAPCTNLQELVCGVSHYQLQCIGALKCIDNAWLSISFLLLCLETNIYDTIAAQFLLTSYMEIVYEFNVYMMYVCGHLYMKKANI